MKQTRSNLALGATLLLALVYAWTVLGDTPEPEVAPAASPVLATAAEASSPTPSAAIPLVAPTAVALAAEATSAPVAAPTMAVPFPTASPHRVGEEERRPIPGPTMGEATLGGQNLHMPEYLAAVSWLDRQGRLALSPEQARALIPLLAQYQSAHTAVPEVRRALVAALDARQRAWLDANVPKRRPTPDPNQTAEQILLKSAAALRARLARR